LPEASRQETRALQIGTRILGVFEQNNDRTFLDDTLSRRVYTYGEFRCMAAAYAEALQAQGVARGDRVALLLTNSTDFAALYFACLFLGATAVPLNPVLHPDELAFILESVSPRIVIYSPRTIAKVKDYLDGSGLACAEIVRAGVTPAEDRPDDSLRLDPAAPGIDVARAIESLSDDFPFSIHFTSGTTSRPKGVVHTAGSLFGNALAFNETMQFSPQHRLLHVMPMSYMAGFLNTLLAPFCAGSAVVLGEAFSARTSLTFWHAVKEYRVNALWLAPTMLSAILRADRSPDGGRYSREHVRAVCVGTAPLPIAVRTAFEERYGVPVLESYGLSESLIVTANVPKTRPLAGSVGCLLPGVELQVRDASDAQAQQSADGDIYVRTPHAMAGYFRDDSLRADESDADGWFPTGDVGHLDDDGNLFIVARKKDLIIRGGVNISPRAVEDVLLCHGAVQEVAVIGLPDAFYGEEVAAVLVLVGGSALERVQPELERLCREKLNDYSLPTRFFALPALPLSSSGKVQKAKLRSMLGTKGDSG